MFTCSKTAGLDGLAGAWHKIQPCIKLCAPIICSNQQCWTRRVFFFLSFFSEQSNWEKKKITQSKISINLGK